MDMGSRGAGLPIWNGKNQDPMEWDNYRYKLQGYCAARGMSALLKRRYVPPKNPAEDEELQEGLMGILLQTTEDVAGMVVRPFAEDGDGVGAWRALITRYGNDSLEPRQAKQIEYTQKVYKLKYEDRHYLLDTMHVLEHLFVELDKLECELPDSYKRNTVLLQLRTITPEIYTAVVSRTEMTYTSTVVEVKKLAALNSTIDNTGGGSRTPAEVFYSKTAKKSGKRWTPKQNQCFWCLEVGHRFAHCPSKKKGEQLKVRPDGTRFKSEPWGRSEENADPNPPCTGIPILLLQH